jgi:hypothetical protein
VQSPDASRKSEITVQKLQGQIRVHRSLVWSGSAQYSPEVIIQSRVQNWKCITEYNYGLRVLRTQSHRVESDTVRACWEYNYRVQSKLQCRSTVTEYSVEVLVLKYKLRITITNYNYRVQCRRKYSLSTVQSTVT